MRRARAACRAPRPATRCWRRARRQSRVPSAPSLERSGVLPPITMLTSCGQGRRPIAAICSAWSAPRRSRCRRRPRGRHARAPSRRAKPSTAIASVRATISRSGSVRASTAALIFATISAAGITSLPSKWPQRLGNTWSSIWIASAPARSSVCTVRRMLSALPKPVSASTISGPGNTSRIAATCADELAQRHEPVVGNAEEGVGDAGAGHIGGVEAAIGDHARGERIGHARQDHGRAGLEHGPELLAGGLRHRGDGAGSGRIPQVTCVQGSAPPSRWSCAPRRRDAPAAPRAADSCG